MSITNSTRHPILACVAAVSEELTQVAGVDPMYLSAAEKAAVLQSLAAETSRLEELRLRVLATADDVAVEAGARDAAAWYAHQTRVDGPVARRDLRLARALDRDYSLVAAGLSESRVNLAQARVIIHALDQLPDDLDPDLKRKAEAHLVDLAAEFAPAELRVLGRRVLEVVAPEVAEEAERKRLEDEETNARRDTRVTRRSNGAGRSRIILDLSDQLGDRFLGYLEAYASPRRPDGTELGLGKGDGDAARLPYPVRLGHAFVALLEHLDPQKLPDHGGVATKVMVTLDLDALLAGIGVATTGTGGRISAAEARRLACTAGLIPAVLDGKSQILDLGRTRRLFSTAQRDALRHRDKTCRAEGCDIPAAWCESHHLKPWAKGGRTDLADGVLLCSHHHHLIHGRTHHHERLPSGDLRFTRKRC